IVDFVNLQQGFLCPCHSSSYDLNGEVTSPPAAHPLQHYACSFDGSDNIIVDTFTPVSATTRLTMQD
ncbi:MAG: Rieske 2Fe-2S domain-containing protein, partial [Myxococcales bacterium]|nr:Rieske 2Fe-2S domain-containing protein [Myxococcales bacterium]